MEHRIYPASIPWRGTVCSVYTPDTFQNKIMSFVLFVLVNIQYMSLGNNLFIFMPELSISFLFLYSSAFIQYLHCGAIAEN